MERTVKLILVICLVFLSQSFSFSLPPDEFKYVKEVNGVRIYYAVKAFSPKPGKTAKKIVFKLKNSGKAPKTISLKATVSGDKETKITKEFSQCLKANEEHLKIEIPTDFKEVKEVKLEGEKTTEGGC